MEQMVHDVGRNGRIVDDIISECRPGNTSIALVGRTKHAEVLTDLLKKKGIKAEFCVATIDVEDASGKKKKKKKAIPKAIRDQIVADFKEGKLEVLVATYDLLAEGFNYKPLNRLFMASPIKWEGWVEQALGRIRRPSEGKTDAIAYDYVDEQIAMFIKQAEVRYQSVYRVMDMPVEET
jgi:superfamily II DNA or RNA helicase